MIISSSIKSCLNTTFMILASMLAVPAADAAAVNVTSVYRYAVADVNTYDSLPAVRVESTAGGHFYTEFWSTYPPPNQPFTGVYVIHDSTVLADDTSFTLTGSFLAHPHWYYPANEYYLLGAELHFTLAAPAALDFAMSQSCKSSSPYSDYCTTGGTYFPAWIDSYFIWDVSGLLSTGDHVLKVLTRAQNPFYGEQRMNFDFHVTAVPHPIPEPGSLALAGVACAILGLMWRRTLAAQGQRVARD